MTTARGVCSTGGPLGPGEVGRVVLAAGAIARDGKLIVDERPQGER